LRRQAVTAKKPDPDLTVDFKSGKIAARGSEAISAVKLPLTIILCVRAAAIAVFLLLLGYYHADLIAIRTAVGAVVSFFGR
jgi:hypothetical protein